MVVTPAPYLSISVSEAVALPIPAPPEDVNHHTFTSLLDHRARDQPSRLAVGFPQPDKQTCQTFTYLQLARRSKRLAAKLRDILQTRCEANRQPIISLLGPSGPDFLMTILACWHLGAAVLPIAVGTPALGAAKLLQACQCSILLHCSSQTQLAEEIGSCESHDKHLLLKTWPGAGDEECHTELQEPLFEASPDDTLVIFHSSGSSGMPKPLVQLHKFWSNSLLTAPGRNQAAFTTTPLFHGGLSDFFRSVQAAAPLFFFPWHLQLAPTINNIIQSATGCGQEIRYFLSVPFILEMLMADEKGTAFLRAMELVSTGGAPLSGAVGDRAVTEENIKLVSRLGSSECGFLMSSFRDFENDKEWSWLRIPDKLGQRLLRFERVGDSSEEVFELVVSAQWPAKRLSNRGDGSFATGDLFERHPDLANRWRYKRRGDDSIVMINGKKVNGALVESLLRSSSLVEDAIVFGANRPLLGAIVFPSTDEYRQPSFLADFSTLLKSFIARLPSHGRLPLEMVHFGDASLYASLPRSSKGTLQKGLALNKLDDLIDNVYDRFMEGDAPSAEAKKMLDGQELTEWLKILLEDICDKRFDSEDDFYRSGVDSIMAARIRAGVHQGLELQGFRLESNDIYDHPTIKQLSSFIQSKGDHNTVERADVMQEMVRKYSKRLVPSVHSVKPKPGGSKLILLTGATGALGCRVLHELLQGSGKSGKIISLVRAKDLETARRRVVTAMHERGLTLEERMVIFITDLQDPALHASAEKSVSVLG